MGDTVEESSYSNWPFMLCPSSRSSVVLSPGPMDWRGNQMQLLNAYLLRFLEYNGEAETIPHKQAVSNGEAFCDHRPALRFPIVFM